MIILGIESSCDETSLALVEDGYRIIALETSTQTQMHKLYGGVVPELASRRHTQVLLPLLDHLFKTSHLGIDDVDAIACTYTPGLMGALLVGLTFAKTLAALHSIPFVAVHHIEAHLYSGVMTHLNALSLQNSSATPFHHGHAPIQPSPRAGTAYDQMIQREIQSLLPAIGVVVSGGHTLVVALEELGNYRVLSRTIDDSAGEAFDKVGVMLGLDYPAGAEIERLATSGNHLRFPFKRPHVKSNPKLFSFSGLKTQLHRTIEQVKSQGPIDDQTRSDICASFQEVALTDLTQKTMTCLHDEQLYCKDHASEKPSHYKSIWVGGGVSASLRFKEMMLEACNKLSPPPKLIWPERLLSTDQAAMIAGIAYHQLQHAGPSPLSIEPKPRTWLGDYQWPRVDQ